MTREEFERKQRLFDTAMPATCAACGVLVCIAPSKNGVLCRYDLDDDSNPTFTPHKCAVATAKETLRERILEKDLLPE